MLDKTKTEDDSHLLTKTTTVKANFLASPYHDKTHGT